MNTAITSRPLSLNNYLMVAIASIAGALLLTMGGRLSFFSIGPVPVTMQMLAVFLLIAFYPARLAFMSGVTWLAVGMFTPVFATPGALTPVALFGPSGGYIMGMVLALGLSGWAASRIPHKLTKQLPHPVALSLVHGTLGRLLELLVAFVIIYYVGMLWLSIQMPGKALTYGMLPFFGYDVLKLTVALAVGVGFKNVRHSLRQLVFKR